MIETEDSRARHEHERRVARLRLEQALQDKKQTEHAKNVLKLKASSTPQLKPARHTSNQNANSVLDDPSQKSRVREGGGFGAVEGLQSNVKGKSLAERRAIYLERQRKWRAAKRGEINARNREWMRAKRALVRAKRKRGGKNG